MITYEYQYSPNFQRWEFVVGVKQGDKHRVLAQYLPKNFDHEMLLSAFGKTINTLNRELGFE